MSEMYKFPAQEKVKPKREYKSDFNLTQLQELIREGDFKELPPEEYDGHWDRTEYIFYGTNIISTLLADGSLQEAYVDAKKAAERRKTNFDQALFYCALGNIRTFLEPYKIEDHSSLDKEKLAA